MTATEYVPPLTGVSPLASLPVRLMSPLSESAWLGCAGALAAFCAACVAAADPETAACVAAAELAAACVAAGLLVVLAELLFEEPQASAHAPTIPVPVSAAARRIAR